MVVYKIVGCLYCLMKLLLKRLSFIYWNSLREKCPYSDLFWSAFSRLRTEYGEILGISPYSVQMREKADQNNFKYGHFLRSDYLLSTIFLLKKNVKCFSFINALRNKVYLCGITSIVVEALFRDILRMIGHMSSNVRALIFTRGKRNQQNIITQALSFKHLQVLGVSIGKVIFWLCWRYLKLAFGVKNHHNSHNQENKGQLMKVDSC